MDELQIAFLRNVIRMLRVAEQEIAGRDLGAAALSVKVTASAVDAFLALCLERAADPAQLERVLAGDPAAHTLDVAAMARRLHARGVRA